ncbi:MAG: lamin tail domain-containing protein [Muribaculaceae bacterium]|nr:lamin tail domain-containing protein [Muribaculaceae bacterium]
MKKIQLALMLMAAMLLATSCVEDKVYEGPSKIEAVSMLPEAPTSFDDVVVTATVSGLQAVKTATLNYKAGSTAGNLPMSGNGNTWSATIPAQPDGTKVTYTVTFVNEAGYTTVSPEKEYTVGDKPSDFTKLVLNELYAAADADAEKFIELYNNGDDPIKLKDVIIKKDENEVWKGLAGEVIMGHSYFTIVGAKGTTERGISSGFSNKKSVLIELYDPNNNLVDKFQRGEKEDAWGNQSLAKVTGSWSRCPNGTGKYMITDVTTLGAKNPDSGTEDPTVVQ